MILMSSFPIISVIGLLTVSFFVLVAVTKIESKALQSYGRILATVLCIFAGVVVIAYIYFSVTGKYLELFKSPMGHYKGYHRMMER